jgi:L-lactate dehydrogenase (cytochrome)
MSTTPPPEKAAGPSAQPADESATAVGQSAQPSGQTAKAAYAASAGLPRRLRNILCLDDFEPAARRHLPRPLFGYIVGAAETNRSYEQNRRQFDDYSFTPRVMVDVSHRSCGVTLFGKTYRAPFGIAPVGISAISAYRGDLVLAQAAQDAGVPAIMSGTSLIRMEEVAAAAPGTWFQAYMPGDDSRLEGLVDRVAAAGFEVLVVTVDIPVWANRENNVRTGFSMPLRPSLRLAWDGLLRPRWLLGTFAKTLLRHGMPHFENSFATRGAPMLSASAVRDTTGREHLNWDHIRRIRRQWRGTLVIKGILHEQDALLAHACGADGIIVSNHGGRQLDGAASPLRVLPRIADAVGNRLTVMMDGGIRRGSDVLTALGLGARCAFAGRPFMYAAAVGGRQGVSHALTLLHDEVSRNMAMLGINTLDELDANRLLVRSGAIYARPGEPPTLKQ